MKHKPQTLTTFTTLTALAFSASAIVFGCLTPISVFAQQDAPPAADSPPKGSQLKKSDRKASEVFDVIKTRLDGFDSFSCQIYQTFLMTGHRLHAAGRYYHASGNRFRLEYRIFPIRATKKADKEHLQLDGEPEDTSKLKVTGSLTQVSDGSVLWSYWVNADQKQLTRRNIGEIVEAADSAPNYSSAQSLSDLGVGGMQTLLTQIQTGMDFGQVQELQAKSGKMLVLTGRWNAKTLKDVFQVPDDPNAQLPEFVPDYVRLFVSEKGMLPAKIQYLKKHPNPEVKQVQPLATLDFRNVEFNGKIPDETFVFKRPDDQKITEVDLTSQVIEGIKNSGAADEQAKPAPESARQ